MIHNIGTHLKTGFTRDILRVAVLLVALLTLAPKIQSQTTLPCMTVPHGCNPSDVFFSDSPSPSFGSNLKARPSIVKKGVMLRGWLTRVQDPGPFGDAVYHNNVVEGGVYLGIEDVHYHLILDYDYINGVYGNDNPLFFLNAVVPGDPVDSQTKPIPLADSGNGTSSGIGINSFWLPNGPPLPLQIKGELNAWHQNGSHHCDQILGCGIYRNYDPMGTPPAGWIHKDDYMQIQAADNWWPFDPDNPDGQPKSLQSGDYVEIAGTLWQDTAHDAGQPPLCWGQINHNQDGWLEIHPVDYITHVIPAGGLRPSPVDQWYKASDGNWYPQHFSLDSAKAGVRRVLNFSLCADATGAAGNGSGRSGSDDRYAESVCPEAHYDYTTFIAPGSRTTTSLVPHFLELIDGRFSTPQSIGHGVGVNSTYPDCVSIQAWLTGLPLARFKATYVVWWTPPVMSITGTTVRGPNSVTSSVLSAQASQVQVTTPALTVTISSTGPASSPVTDTVTVTSYGAPVVGATVSSGNSTSVTNASGVVVITHSTCFGGGQVAKVGGTTVPVRTPVQCSIPATVSKTGYQSASFNLP